MARRRSPAPDAVDLILEQWARQDPELDASAMAVFGRLHRSFLRYQAQLARVFEEHGITMAAFDVLAALRRSGPPFRQTMGDLAGITLVTSGGITQRVDRLESAGLVAREKDAHDGRVVHVQLTDEGRALIDRVTRAHFANEKEMLAGLGETEQRQLAKLLRLLERSLEDSEVRSASSA
ncbi:MarR family winged helix-turn-helix transcriptional regulator [Pseudonocardia nigra]|uniref:MarR family winged helix-turn-helix transcriptional regulator n=1 Tax=Pseudonocardia nigra TaxID=1921578 RepID=UPI001C5D399B|nr:MarR family transcriptional regulator [Pseudonocardia nigra]